MTPPVALTIAGSDSGGGAGIQADLATFGALGVHGTCALTAVTAQSTRGVAAVEVLDPALVAAQIDAVTGDMTVAAVKTGMLAATPIVDVVARHAAKGRLPRLVVDPVMVATSGDPLARGDAVPAYRELLAHALVATPNAAEATRLLGLEETLGRPALVREHARELRALGCGYLVVTGLRSGQGDRQRSVDVVVGDREVHELSAPVVATRNDHGTGCAFSAATAALLARGLEPLEALRGAKAHVTDALDRAARWRLGAGRGPLDLHAAAHRRLPGS